MGLLGSGGDKGRYFFDLYNVTTGQKVAGIRGHYDGVSPVSFGDRSYWLAGSRFVGPVSPETGRLVVCEVQ
jgi:hypothetical protein